jgi:hypothetical protein
MSEHPAVGFRSVRGEEEVGGVWYFLYCILLTTLTQGSRVQRKGGLSFPLASPLPLKLCRITSTNARSLVLWFIPAYHLLQPPPQCPKTSIHVRFWALWFFSANHNPLCKNHNSRKRALMLVFGCCSLFHPIIPPRHEHKKTADI